MPRTLRGAVTEISYTATEVANARHRGTTVENLRDVANSKINDAITALKELAAVCDEDNRNTLTQMVQALG